jgi:hypothetical protein
VSDFELRGVELRHLNKVDVQEAFALNLECKYCDWTYTKKVRLNIRAYNHNTRISHMGRLICLRHQGIDEHFIFDSTSSGSRICGLLTSGGLTSTEQYFDIEEHMDKLQILFANVSLSSDLCLSMPLLPYYYLLANVRSKAKLLCYAVAGAMWSKLRAYVQTRLKIWYADGSVGFVWRDHYQIWKTDGVLDHIRGRMQCHDLTHSMWLKLGADIQMHQVWKEKRGAVRLVQRNQFEKWKSEGILDRIRRDLSLESPILSVITNTGEGYHITMKPFFIDSAHGQVNIIESSSFVD